MNIDQNPTPEPYITPTPLPTAQGTPVFDFDYDVHTMVVQDAVGVWNIAVVPVWDVISAMLLIGFTISAMYSIMKRVQKD
jgi:hypothetical protein